MRSLMSYAVHAPALSLPEAAMLPALETVLSERRMERPLPPAQPVDSHPQGSMAGRTVLKYIKSAPARRPGR